MSLWQVLAPIPPTKAIHWPYTGPRPCQAFCAVSFKESVNKHTWGSTTDYSPAEGPCAIGSIPILLRERKWQRMPSVTQHNYQGWPGPWCTEQGLLGLKLLCAWKERLWSEDQHTDQAPQLMGEIWASSAFLTSCVPHAKQVWWLYLPPGTGWRINKAPWLTHRNYSTKD